MLTVTDPRPSRPGAAASQGRGYTMTEVAKHSTPESCWTVVEGKVYDVTAFLKEHPGGERAVLALAGVDASEAFVAMHPPMLRPRLERFRIGHVEVRADRGGEGGKSEGRRLWSVASAACKC